MQPDKFSVLFAGGGTGGHLFPLVAVADALKKSYPGISISFAGTKERLEASVIPSLGYTFYPITVEGFNKKGGMKRIVIVLMKLIAGFFQSVRLITKLRPKVVVASGAYVSAPVVLAAKFMSVKIVLLEQNSFPGLTIRLMERFADELHLSFQNATRYLKYPGKHKFSGNPVRPVHISVSRERSREIFGLNGGTVILFLGGSLGAQTLNDSLKNILQLLKEQNISVIWQTGNHYFEKYKECAGDGVVVLPFIEDMSAAYAAADIIITRAGATTMAELAIIGKPVILIPSPNVADNHQFVNASSFVSEGACILIEDKNVSAELLPAVIALAGDNAKQKEMGEKIAALARPQAAETIAQSIVRLAKNV